jgi:RNA polymerase sigma-70 factor (ECF subfamily)
MLRRLPRQPDDAQRRRREFEALARQHYADLYRAACRLTGGGDDGADLTQEALVRGYMGFQGFEPGTNFRAWMLRIMANTHISRYRRRRRRPEEVGWEATTDATGRETLRAAETAPGPEAETFAQFHDAEVDEALAALPEDFRMVAIMSDVYGLQYQEIADALGIPIGTVRSRLFRARRLLREHLRAYAEERGLLRGGFDE